MLKIYLYFPSHHYKLGLKNKCKVLFVELFSYNSLSFQGDFDKRLSIIFQILVMTLPSMYSVAYFTFWQNKVTSLVN